MKDRSSHGFVHFASDVKSWMNRPPSVEVARPARCPCCGAASRPLGKPLQMHGHGLRERQLRGPLEPGGPPVLIILLLRRYLCLLCGCVATVVPRGVLRGRLFSSSAIALALALFGLEEKTEVETRKKTSPWSIGGVTAADGWLCLHRWVRAIRRGRLFSGLFTFSDTWTARQVAARAARALASRGPSEHRAHAPSAAAFIGAAHIF